MEHVSFVMEVLDLRRRGARGARRAHDAQARGERARARALEARAAGRRAVHREVPSPAGPFLAAKPGFRPPKSIWLKEGNT